MPRLLSRLRSAAAARRHSSYLLEAALELAGVGMVAVATDGCLTHANRHARELLGAGCGALGTYPETWMRQLRPRTASGLLLPVEDLPPLRALKGEIVGGVDVLVALPRGDVLLETAARPAKDRRGHRHGAVVMLVDVTERRIAEARMRGQRWGPWRPGPVRGD